MVLKPKYKTILGPTLSSTNVAPPQKFAQLQCS